MILIKMNLKFNITGDLPEGDDFSEEQASIWPWVGDGGGVDVLVLCLSSILYNTPVIDLNKVGSWRSNKRRSSSFLAELRSSRGDTSSSEAVRAKTSPREQ